VAERSADTAFAFEQPKTSTPPSLVGKTPPMAHGALMRLPEVPGPQLGINQTKRFW